MYLSDISQKNGKKEVATGHAPSQADRENQNK